MEVLLWCNGEQGPHIMVFALVEHVSPVVVISGEEEPELELEPEPQPLPIPEPSISEGPDEKYLIESLCQENRALRIELQSFKSETQKVMKSLQERVCELEAELDNDRSCQQHVQANALALQAELDRLCRQQAKQAQQELTGAEKKVRASKRRYGKMKEKQKVAQGQNTSQLTPTLIAGGLADERNSPVLGDGVCVNHSGCLSGFCQSWMVKCGCRRPCVPGSYPHAGCRSAGHGLAPPSTG